MFSCGERWETELIFHSALALKIFLIIYLFLTMCSIISVNGNISGGRPSLPRPCLNVFLMLVEFMCFSFKIE